MTSCDKIVIILFNLARIHGSLRPKCNVEDLKWIWFDTIQRTWEGSQVSIIKLRFTVKPVLSGHSKLDKTKVLMTNGSLMKVKSIAECSHWPALNYNLSWNQFLVFVLSGRLRQVLLYFSPWRLYLSNKTVQSLMKYHIMMPHPLALHLGHHCLSKYLFRSFP